MSVDHGGRRVLWIVLAAVLLAGCKAQSRRSMDEVYAAYQRGDYAEAYRQAQPIADGAGGPRSSEAAYMAGSAAMRMGRLHEAERYLSIAAQSRDPRLSADATAELGLTYAQLNRHDRAAASLLDAAGRLSGQDRANAYFYAGLSQQKLGQWAQARTSFTLARSASNDSAFREEVSQHLRTTGYTLQMGAFAEAPNARAFAESVAAHIIALRLGPPRIVPIEGPAGKTLHAVQVGQFSSYANALAARSSLGSTTAIVVPLR
jgi:tetratricopeptide (TPR) repeat protein